MKIYKYTKFLKKESTDDNAPSLEENTSEGDGEHELHVAVKFAEVEQAEERKL